MKKFHVALLLILLLTALPINAEEAWYAKIGSEWGGHVRGGGTVSRHEENSVYLLNDENPFLDGFLEGRIKNKIFWTDRLYTEVHYELVLSGGDQRSSEQTLLKQFGNLPGGLSMTKRVSDERRLLDLTDTLSKDDRSILYHRLDRAFLSVSTSWGLIRLGRQAVTWGNGFLFNPMDLFNPFSPSDIIRDYKTGDDLVQVQIRLPQSGEVQMLYVPRRNPLTGNVEWDASSLGGKLHLFQGTFEFDVMAARHYDDYVIGAGMVGYWGGAVWRLDTTYTFLQGQESDRNGFFSMAANMDYSWLWAGKNVYGMLEFYYQGLGEEDYQEAVFEPELMARLVRGELFTLGKAYLAGRINVEVHPLLNIYVTVINNLQDPSGFIRPYAVADLMQNLQLTFGATLAWGDTGTEYGGFHLPGTGYLLDSADSIYAWLTWYF